MLRSHKVHEEARLTDEEQTSSQVGGQVSGQVGDHVIGHISDHVGDILVSCSQISTHR